MKDMLHMGIFLFIVAAVAGILLSYTESVTAPLILENRQKAEELARREVLPSAATFTDTNIEDPSADMPRTFSSGFDTAGKLAGVVVKVAPKGYAGPIEMVLGLDTTGKITGFKILSQKETPGLGTKLADPVFVEPFKKLLSEKENPIFLVKKDGGDVDGITAATISSRAFCAGIREALDIFVKIQPKLSSLTSAKVETAPSLPENTTDSEIPASEATATATENIAPASEKIDEPASDDSVPLTKDEIDSASASVEVEQ